MVPLPPWSTIFRSKSAVGLNFLRSRISLFRSRTLMPFPTKFTLCCELSAPWCMRKLTEDAILGEQSEVPSSAPSTSSSVGRKDSIVHISWKEAPYKLKWIPIELLQRHCGSTGWIDMWRPRAHVHKPNPDKRKRTHSQKLVRTDKWFCTCGIKPFSFFLPYMIDSMILLITWPQ